MLTSRDIAEPRNVDVHDPTPWVIYHGPSQPTLVCEGSWLSTLHPSTLVSTRFVPPGGPMSGYDMREAILQFPSQAAAYGAYKTAVAWLATCPATLAPPGVATTYAAENSFRTPAAPKSYNVSTYQGTWQKTTVVGPYADPQALAYDQFVGWAGGGGTRLLALQFSEDQTRGDAQADEPFFATVATAANRAR